MRMNEVGKPVICSALRTVHRLS